MTHRHLEYSNYPPKYSFQYIDVPPRTPIARKEAYGSDLTTSQLSKTWKFNQMPSNSSDLNYFHPSTTDSKKTLNSDYLKLSKQISFLKGEFNSIKAETKKLGQISIDKKWTPKRNDDSLNKTLGQSTMYVSNKNIQDDSNIKFDASDLRRQLDVANKKNTELQQKNNLLECLIQSSDSEISKIKQSQISNPFSQSYSEGEKLLQSARLLQFQRDEAENKRKNMEQILLIQDQKMKDKECLVKILTQKIDQSTKQYQNLQKQLINQNKKIEQIQKVPKKLTQHIEIVNQDIVMKKEKEISFLKAQLNLAKDLLSKKDDGTKQKQTAAITRLTQQTKRMRDQLLIRDKQLAKQKESNLRLKNSQDQIIKKAKDQTLQHISQMRVELANHKQNSIKNQSIYQNQVKTLKDKVIQLTSQLSKKEDTFVKDKDHVMQQLVAHQTTIRNLQYDVQKALARQKSLQQANVRISTTVSDQQQMIKRLKDDSGIKKDWVERQSALMKDKQTYQKLLISQQSSINSLKSQIQNLKDQTFDLKKRIGKESSLLSDKQTLHKLVKQKETNINSLNTQILSLQKQIGLEKELQNQKQLHLRMLLTQQGTIKQLRQQNTNLLKSASRQKSLLTEKQNLQRLFLLKQDQIKSLKENINGLTLQASKSKGLQLQKDGWSKLLKNQQSDLKKLRQQVQKLSHQCGRESILIQQKDGLQKLIVNQNTIIANSKQQIYRLNTQISINKNLLVQKQYYCKLSNQRQNEIKSLKEQTTQINKLIYKQKQLIQDKDKFQKLISQQQSTIKQLKQQLSKVNIQNIKNRNILNQKDAWIKIANERQNQLKKIKQQNREFNIKASKEKQLIQQKEGYQQLINNKDTTIKTLKEENTNLQQQVAKERDLQQQKDNYQKLVQQLNQTITTLKQQIYTKTMASNQELKQLDSQSRKNAAVTKKLELQNQYLSDENKRLKESSQSLQNQKFSSNTAYAKLKCDYDSNNIQLKNCISENQRLVFQRDQFIKDKSEEQSKTRKLQSDIYTLNRQVSQLKQKLARNNLVDSKKQSQSNVIKVQSTIVKLQTHTSNSYSIQNSLKQEIKQQNQTISTLQTVIRTMEQINPNESCQKIKQLQVMLNDSNDLLIKQGLSRLDKRIEEMRLI